jgi:hypothetical protein
MLFNLGRCIFLTAWAYFNGTTSIEGTVHDAAGYCVLLLTVSALFGVLLLFSGTAQKSRS